MTFSTSFIKIRVREFDLAVALCRIVLDAFREKQRRSRLGDLDRFFTFGRSAPAGD
jgi:hypothetical protein